MKVLRKFLISKRSASALFLSSSYVNRSAIAMTRDRVATHEQTPMADLSSTQALLTRSTSLVTAASLQSTSGASIAALALLVEQKTREKKRHSKSKRNPSQPPDLQRVRW
eukprot:6469386-Amphidinium_carterae.5